ncbi:unnamed protein product [Candidula unifasciata]|uniref:peptidylprolyl isomerase n=1 Tax=Candidula unifasciata TaxID=100452 RepID=A0A8S3ZF48_9EUPU|nr:unnamed protein product [Candidula unifasciata]
MGVEVESLSPGDGKTYPKKGDTVIVHYTGTLTNGKKFDSSKDRGKPFETKIGVGKVIRGWDEGFTQLCKGEKAKLTITPDYGYGKEGAGGIVYSRFVFFLTGSTIPPNATLIFEVELLDIKRA